MEEKNNKKLFQGAHQPGLLHFVWYSQEQFFVCFITPKVCSNNIDLFMLVITDIIATDSEAIVLGNRVDIAEKAFGKKLENNRMILKGVSSRKKQVFPALIENS